LSRWLTRDSEIEVAVAAFRGALIGSLAQQALEIHKHQIFEGKMGQPWEFI